MQSFFKITEKLAGNNDLTSTAKLVLAKLASRANPQTGLCNPKIDTLARELGRHPHTIQRTVTRLRKLGWIQTRKGQRGLYFAVLNELPKQLELDQAQPGRNPCNVLS
jgi:DNA-binding MarR family transcriptional regulator